MNIKKILLSIILLSLSNTVFAEDFIWKNDLRTLFNSNQAKICGINLRSFNANDTNKNDLIDNGEESGNFLNAIERLDEIKELNINTLHVLPITPVGKLKALGTAGSLYAISDFWSINPQLIDTNSKLSPKEQAKLFISEAHKRGIRIIIDLPSCGSYDLFLTHPELFIKDEKNCSIVPTDWTDVRLLNTGNNEKLNRDVLDAHKKFVDLVLEIGADGIRADVATIKPSKFWEEIIKYARENNPEFMFLAEASDSWREPPSQHAEFTPFDKLLEAGFDGYYGSFFNLKEWNAEEFIEHVKFNQKLISSYNEPKSVILSFTTHDEVSPIILHGVNFSKMIAWLEAVLPFNPYIIDGFYTGDDYLYSWENSVAKNTETDDDTYFVHRGKLDIFNFSRKPNGNNIEILNNFKQAYEFRSANSEIITKGDFAPLKTNDKKVYAFSRNYNNDTIIVIGNLDFEKGKKKISIKSPIFKYKTKFEYVHGSQIIKQKRKELVMDLNEGEIIIIRKVNL